MDAARSRGFVDRNTAWVLVAALAAGLGLWAGQAWFAPARAPAPAVAGPALQTVRLFNEARDIPTFRLDAERGALGSADIAGRWAVVFLGFTSCPSICPTTLTTLAKAQDDWRKLPEGIRPRVLFVSVDPQRDTPAKVAAYAHFHHADTLSATAAEPALHDFAQSLGMVYQKALLPNGDYTMDHSSALVLIDPQGRQAGLIRPPFDSAAISADLAALARNAP